MSRRNFPFPLSATTLSTKVLTSDGPARFLAATLPAQATGKFFIATSSLEQHGPLATKLHGPFHHRQGRAAVFFQEEDIASSHNPSPFSHEHGRNKEFIVLLA